MADQIIPGAKVGNWLVASISGRAAMCVCVCGAPRAIAVAALLDGTASPSCGCSPISPERLAAERAEAEERLRRRERGSWRPGA
jgi:hypothetical protein